MQNYSDNDSVEKIIFEKMFSSNIKIKINDTVVLGRKNKVVYVFGKDGEEYQLFGVSYIVDTEQAREITNKLTPVRLYKTYYQTNGFKDSFDQKVLDEIQISRNEITQEFDNDFIRLMFVLVSGEYELEGEGGNHFNRFSFELPKKKTKATGTLYIYDYNEDTRVYIYDNIIKDKAVVVYVPHEQDY